VEEEWSEIEKNPGGARSQVKKGVILSVFGLCEGKPFWGETRPADIWGPFSDYLEGRKGFLEGEGARFGGSPKQHLTKWG